jgi:molybdopterin molybdotransferase
MLSVHEAESIILKRVQPLDASVDQAITSLLQAHQRILARDITSPLDFPYWDNSAMDGYAVRYADIQGCTPEQPIALAVVTEIPAGTCPQVSLSPGQAARIFTGAMMPTGADTVVMQENTQRLDPDRVQILECPQPQAFVRPKGAYCQAGTTVLAQGIALTPADIAILATVQCIEIPVYRRPVVAILSTGNELVAPDQSLQPGQIVDSNRYALAALAEATGAEVHLLNPVGDQPAHLKTAITQAIAIADLVLSSGGVSVGDYDYVDQILAELGADIHICSVAMKPGKPLTFATFPDQQSQRSTLYFGLPGNPVSALVGFWRFVQPALRKLSGQRPPWGPTFVEARWSPLILSSGDNQEQLLPTKLEGKSRETYLWGQLSLKSGKYEFSLARGTHSSGNLINLAQTNGLAVLPIDHPPVQPGDPLQVLQVGRVEG